MGQCILIYTQIENTPHQNNKGPVGEKMLFFISNQNYLSISIETCLTHTLNIVIL